MRILLFGPPGVGKGTQADLLAEKYQLTKFSTGDILRDEVALSSSLGNKIKDYIGQGNLVPDDMIFELVEDFLIENKDLGILFDGFPRNMNQALNLERSLAQSGQNIDLALEMHVSEEEIIKRLANRRYCPNCGRIYNFITSPPKNSNICDSCGHKLAKRSDDDEAIIKKRLTIYEEETKPLTDYYKSLSIYRQVDASDSQEEVLKRISKLINGHFNKR